MIGRTTEVCVYLGIASRGRKVRKYVEDGIWRYSFDYTYGGERQQVRFERKYELAENLIDAVIDNEQIKRHGKIIIPERAGQRHEAV